MALDLKGRQYAAVERMLNLNRRGADAGSSGGTQDWKVLVYDSAGRDIISPLLNVAQLRKNGVTLHMMIDAEREPIPDVPAVYFVRPTAENISRIAQDCSQHLYSAVHLNFISKLERKLMEQLARDVIASSSVQVIAKVYDQYLDFVSLEPVLFTLNQPNSYLAYNGNGVSEEAIQGAMSRISYGLFSVMATLGTVPVSATPKSTSEWNPTIAVGRPDRLGTQRDLNESQLTIVHGPDSGLTHTVRR